MTLKEKGKQTTKVFGIDLPMWQDCKNCGVKLACRFTSVAYSQPCDKCKATEEYQKEHNKPKSRSMDEMLAVDKPVAIYEGYGRMFYVNSKGNIIKDEKQHPVKLGK